MSNISTSGVLDENLNSGYVSNRYTVGGSAVEAKAGASALYGRQTLTIYNDGNKTFYYGPLGVTQSGVTKGVPVEATEFITLNVTDNIKVYIIAPGNTDVIVQEFS